MAFTYRCAKAGEGRLLATTVRNASGATDLRKWSDEEVTRFEKDYLDPMKSQKVLVAVETSTSKVVAFVYYNTDAIFWSYKGKEVCGEILELFVMQRCHGQNIGRALLRRALTDIEAKHVLTYVESKAAAVKFYQKHDFETCDSLFKGCIGMIRRLPSRSRTSRCAYPLL